VLSKHMVHNFKKYLDCIESMEYVNSHATLDARDFGLPQARQRVFTVSVLRGTPFDFSALKLRPMRDISWFLETNVDECYTVTHPTVYNAIGKGCGEIRKATVIHNCANTITTRQDRTPAQVIDLGNGKYRYLTELECWRLQGYSDEEFNAAASTYPVKRGKMNRTLYHQARNSIPVPILEGLFEAMFLQVILEQPQCQIA